MRKTAEDSRRFYQWFEGYSCDGDGYIYCVYEGILKKNTYTDSNPNEISKNEGTISEDDSNANNLSFEIPPFVLCLIALGAVLFVVILHKSQISNENEFTEL